MSDLLTVIIPVYNEEKHLKPLYNDIAPALDEITGKGNWRMLFVDNGSVDQSKQMILDIIKRSPDSKYISLSAPNYGAALRAGIDETSTEYGYIINVDFWDKDFLHWAYLNREQYDLFLGSKRADPTINNLSPYRKFLSWGLNTLLQLFFGFVGRDTHGQKFIRLSSIKPLSKQCVMQRGQYDTEIVLRALRAGLWVTEVPVPISEKRKQRNFMWRKIYNNLVDIFKLRSVMAQVPWTHQIRYHRWAREDVESLAVFKCHHERPDNSR